MISTLPDYVVIVSLVAGIAGGIAMNIYMRILTLEHAVPADMIRLLGGLFTGKNGGNTRIVGTLIHLTLGFLFGLLYVWGLYTFNGISLPGALPVGLGMGFAHGVVASFAMMYLVYHGHPVESYRKSPITVSTGLVYISGHGLYGLVVALVSGLIIMSL